MSSINLLRHAVCVLHVSFVKIFILLDKKTEQVSRAEIPKNVLQLFFELQVGTFVVLTFPVSSSTSNWSM